MLYIYMLYIYVIYICVCVLNENLQLYTIIYIRIKTHPMTGNHNDIEGQNQGYIEATYAGHILQQELSQLGDVASWVQIVQDRP